STSCIFLLSLHDALPIYDEHVVCGSPVLVGELPHPLFGGHVHHPSAAPARWLANLQVHQIADDPENQEQAKRAPNHGKLSWEGRSEEHTSELQSLTNLVC